LWRSDVTVSRPLVAALLAAIIVVVGTGGCASEPATSITTDSGESAAATGTLTPLERGKIRREILDDVELAIEAWLAGDREAFTKYYGPEPQEQMFVRWDAADADGYVIVRDHERLLLDVTELSPAGGQALVSYTFTDKTVVLDEDGSVAFPASGIEADFQLTLERSEEDSDTWVIVRMLGTKEAAQ
jgi:hypothetical protein